MNVRFFHAEPQKGAPIWWFGGGFDPIPYYTQREDIVHWHRTAKAACTIPSETTLRLLQKDATNIFTYPIAIGTTGRRWHLLSMTIMKVASISHFALMRSVGDHFLPAYQPIVERRKQSSFTENKENFNFTDVAAMWSST